VRGITIRQDQAEHEALDRAERPSACLQAGDAALEGPGRRRELAVYRRGTGSHGRKSQRYNADSRYSPSHPTAKAYDSPGRLAATPEKGTDAINQDPAGVKEWQAESMTRGKCVCPLFASGAAGILETTRPGPTGQARGAIPGNPALGFGRRLD
jgi:hypothetical protein